MEIEKEICQRGSCEVEKQKRKGATYARRRPLAGEKKNSFTLGRIQKTGGVTWRRRGGERFGNGGREDVERKGECGKKEKTGY